MGVALGASSSAIPTPHTAVACVPMPPGCAATMPLCDIPLLGVRLLTSSHCSVCGCQRHPAVRFAVVKVCASQRIQKTLGVRRGRTLPPNCASFPPGRA
eukprot:gene8917-biopygen931